MTGLAVTFISSIDNSEADCEVDSNMRAEQIIQALINEKFIPPLNDVDRNYALRIKGRGTFALTWRSIEEGQTLADAGVISNDRIEVFVTQTRSSGSNPPAKAGKKAPTKIDITFVNAGDNAEIDATLKSSFTTEEVVQMLISEGFIPPLDDIDRNYGLYIQGRGHIAEGQTLADAGVISNDRIRVAPSQRAGGWPELLTVAASIASIVQVVLMVVDMWSRKAKEKDVNKTKITEGKAWNEVKEIRVLMSDGNWVQLDSWLRDPQKLKKFLDVFQLSSGSPKPLFIVFRLENGAKTQLVVSNDPVDRQRLDDFINILKL